jgi:predicted GIY-YIG superfamily endonuclease
VNHDDNFALYRIWGEADQLLYVGISNDFGRRWREHASKQPWWAEKRRLTVDEWFESGQKAGAAEITAIRGEKPKYNKRHAQRITTGEPSPRRPVSRPINELAEESLLVAALLKQAHRCST